MAGKLAALMEELDNRDTNRDAYRQLDNDRARYVALLKADDPSMISEVQMLAKKLGRDGAGVTADQTAVLSGGSPFVGPVAMANVDASTAQVPQKMTPSDLSQLTPMQKIGLGLSTSIPQGPRRSA